MMLYMQLLLQKEYGGGAELLKRLIGWGRL